MEALNEKDKTGQKTVFQYLSEISDISQMSKEERQMYDGAIRKYRDTLCVMEGQRLKGYTEGFEEGIKEWIEKGRAEGEHTKAIEIARQLKALGMDVQTIAATTGLTSEVINGI